MTFMYHASNLQRMHIFVGRLIFFFLLQKNSYGRDSVEPAIKPGETALVCNLVNCACAHIIVRMTTDKSYNNV